MRLIKALCSAQLTTVLDFMMTFILSSILGMYYVLASFIGSLTGGIFNCALNYRWVFPHNGVRKRHVALKYLLVWGASILLNTSGTFLCTEWLKRQSALQTLMGDYIDDIYIVGKSIVAVLVAVLWNYMMQRYFVFSNLRLIKKKRKLQET